MPSMPDVRPLPIYPWPVDPAALELVKRAKAELETQFKVVPVRALPGSPGRMLALGVKPNFVCDYAPVVDPSNYTSVKNALSWVLDETQDVERGVTVLDCLKEIFGPQTRELDDREIFDELISEKQGVHFE